LIDDVWTTGATLLGATTTLADKGGHVAGLSVLAVSRQKVLVNAQACV
jgi:predicted amidophosphoribosyltransferase